MTERDRFEDAWREKYPLHESTIFKRSGLNPDAYVNTRVQDGWLMWQACNASHRAEPKGLTPEWLWSEFMDYCKAQGRAPSECKRLFEIVSRARALLKDKGY